MDYEKCGFYDSEYCTSTDNRCDACITHTRLYPIEELVHEVHYHPDTYRKLFSSGTIPAFKIGGKWYATKQAVIEYYEREAN